MVHTVRLHGGPMHGQVVTLPDDRDHLHILGLMPPVLKPHELRSDDDIPAGDYAIPKREGMYSKVRGAPDDFEWDGWRSHD